jgi:O-antigen/teichoic acid export membrane protein
VSSTRNANLARGATVMVASVTLAKLLGVVYIIPLTSLIGQEGLGIYQNAYALYTILLTLATSGFPTAMGKLISERLALRKYAEVEHIYQVTVKTVSVLAVCAAILIWFGAPLYSSLVALTDTRKNASVLVMSIRALAPSVLVVPIMSALRGYLQGFQKMEPSGYSQAVEQLFRIVAMLIGAYFVWQHTLDATARAGQGAAAATFGSFVGAVAGLILLIAAVLPLRRQFRPYRHRRSGLTNHQVLRLMWDIALPVCAGALVVPASNFLDSVTVENLLMLKHESFHQAASEFGVLTRQAFTFIQLPLAFAMAIGATVLPAISEAKALDDDKTIKRHITTTVRSMFFITFPTAATLLILARPIDYAVFGTYDGANIISSVSFMGIFSGLELISTYMLQGLGKMYRPVRNMVIGIVIKLILNFVLILPFGIMGAAIASTVGYLFSSTLNIMAVKKYSGVQFSVLKLATPSLVSALPLCIVLWCIDLFVHWMGAHWDMRVMSFVDVVLGVGLGGVLYVMTAIWVPAVSAAELQRFPVLGRRLARLSLKLHPNQAAERNRTPKD